MNYLVVCSMVGICHLLLLIAMIDQSAHGFAIGASCSPRLRAMCRCDQLAIGINVYCERTSNISDVFAALVDTGEGLIVDKLTIRSSVVTTLVGPRSTIIMKQLDITGCRIEEIEDGAFDGLADNLEDLVLANNSLSVLPDFGVMSKLQGLNLNGNNLTDIPDGYFHGLTTLRQLRIERNHICQLSSNALNETKNSLELFDISDNCLTAVPAQNLRNMPRLMYLDLSGNAIEEIANLQLMNMPKLKELRMNNNRIARLGPMAFMNVPELQYIYMRGNRLDRIEPNRFQSFRRLEVLDLSENLLKTAPSLKEVISLKQVMLDHNQIELIDTLTFSANPKLSLISIQNNQIRTISRNAFDGLEELSVVLLGNNSISEIDRGMLDGMPNLQKMSLRNNSLTQIDNGTFDSIPLLTTLDLAHNRISTIAQNSFAPLDKLFWLDLSNNRIERLDNGTFKAKVANILLDGNPLICDDKLDWFIEYLVVNQVRTFQPYQPEVTCAGPEAGVRLKELMLKKANDTMRTIGDGGGSNSMLNNLMPNSKIPGLDSLPYLGLITQNLPSLGGVPGLFPGVGRTSELDRAIEQFAGPLTRFATNGQPVASDVNQFLGSIPNLVSNLPGVGNIDLSKIPPEMIRHVLNGGTIPGIPRSAIDNVIKQYMQRMSQAAQNARSGQGDPEAIKKYLPPLSELPQELVTSVVQGEPLPGLTMQETSYIKDYYTQPMPSAVQLPSSAAELIKMLPPNYDLTKLPPAVIEAVSQGRMPDLKLLPPDLVDYIRTHSADMLANAINDPKLTLEEIIKNLPKFERPSLPTFSPYDINQVDDHEMHTDDDARASLIRIWTAIGLGACAAGTVVVVTLLCIWRRHAAMVVASTTNSIDGGGIGVATSEDLDRTRFFLPRVASSPLSMINASSSSSSRVLNPQVVLVCP